MPNPAPMISIEKCERLARIIQILMNSRQHETAALLLKAFAFDPVELMKPREGLAATTNMELDYLEDMVSEAEKNGNGWSGIKYIVKRLASRPNNPPVATEM